MSSQNKRRGEGSEKTNWEEIGGVWKAVGGEEIYFLGSREVGELTTWADGSQWLGTKIQPKIFPCRAGRRLISSNGPQSSI